MKSINSTPDAQVFRSILVIIIILICIISFFVYTSYLNRLVEDVAKERVVTQLRQALSMMLYDHALKGRLKDLQNFHLENPFVVLALYRNIPTNYHGAVSNELDMLKKGWYFNLSSRQIVYHYAEHGISDIKYFMRFEFDDLNLDGVYGDLEVGNLVLVKG